MIMRNFSVVWAISGVSKDQVIKYGSTKQRIPLAQIASWEPVAGRAQTNPNDQIQNSKRLSRLTLDLTPKVVLTTS